MSQDLIMAIQSRASPHVTAQVKRLEEIASKNLLRNRSSHPTSKLLALRLHLSPDAMNEHG
jgi:hypothetical protein